MNQILTTENQKSKKTKVRARTNSSPIEIKGIIKFFAFTLILFGIVLIGEGSYAMYRKAEKTNPSKMPVVTLSRINDKAIIYVEHTEEISKIIYRWNNGEETEIPEGGLTAKEEIILPNEDSMLYIRIEDMKGREANYQKSYLLTGVDINKPSVEIQTEDGNNKMTIIAKDETEIAYMSYKWEGEDEVVVDAETEGQTEIKTEIDLIPGKNKIKIIAEDTNGNIEQIEKEIVASTRPKVNILQDQGIAKIEIIDDIGIAKVSVNLNGRVMSKDNINLKQIRVGPLELVKGNNVISIEVINTSGVAVKGSTQLTY